MARAIDADAFKNEIREIGNERFLETGDQEHLRIAEMVCQYVNKQPTIEAAPVMHGKWIEPEGVEIAITCICSECKKEFPMWAKKDYDYCPNCGARMDGDSE